MVKKLISWINKSELSTTIITIITLIIAIFIFYFRGDFLFAILFLIFLTPGLIDLKNQIKAKKRIK